MPGSFITFIIFAVILLIALVVIGAGRMIAKDKDDKSAATALFIGVFVVGGIITLIPLIIASTTIVKTRSIGIVTTFGKPHGELSNGLHLKAPWSKVTDLDGSIQIDNRYDKENTTVRLGNNSTAQVDNSVRWRIKPGAADQLFLDYKTFDRIRDNLVIRELNSSLNEVLGGFDPIEQLASGQQAVDLGALSNKVADNLRSKVGNQIEVLNVIIPIIHYDQGTQARLDQYNTQVAQTRIAQAQKGTNQALAEANKILADSVNNNPGVLISQCLDIVKATGKPMNCFPWGNGVQPIVPQPQ